jgi:hypothetical protein
MPRYRVQRTFPQAFEIPVADGGADICRGVIDRNTEEGVTWGHSYVSAARSGTARSRSGAACPSFRSGSHSCRGRCRRCSSCRLT